MTREKRGSDSQQTYERGAAVLSIFKRGAEFTKKLIEENQSLRERLAAIESRQHEAAQHPDTWEMLRLDLLNRISSLETENKSILEQLRAVESENQQFAERYVEIEEENNNLANLYVASYQLHSTLDAGEVLKVILEIVINLVGADSFAIYVFDEKTNGLEPVVAEGLPLSSFSRIPMGSGWVGEAVETGDVRSRDLAGASSEDPVVCIPLRVEDRPVGAIVIHSLLQQKEGFSPLDHELFTLLAGHAATAIFASRLYSQSERKLTTIQGFIDLLTK